jgi:hypothetical protein
MESCRLCSKIARLDAGLCGPCRREHGPRTAAFLARGQVDPGFANVTLARVDPGTRQRLLAALSLQYVGQGPGLKKARPRVQRPGQRFGT